MPSNWSVDNVVFSGIASNGKNAQNTEMYNMGEPQKHEAKMKKARHKRLCII